MACLAWRTAGLAKLAGIYGGSCEYSTVLYLLVALIGGVEMRIATYEILYCSILFPHPPALAVDSWALPRFRFSDRG